MTSSLRLHSRIVKTLREFLPPLHRYQRDTLAWMILGIDQARHVHLAKIAACRPGSATLPSKTMQLRRFLRNDAIEPEHVYWPVARQLCEQAAERQVRLRVLVDVVELPGRRKILMAALAYRRRALPLLWQVWRGKGATDAETQIAFLRRLEALFVGLFPEQTQPVIIADGEFRSIELIDYLDGLGWGFRLRLSADTRVHLSDGRRCTLAELAPERGQRRYLQDVYITDLHGYGPLSVAIWWAEGEDAPWFIVTDEAEAGYPTLQSYSRRMWIEELFGDLEGGGFQLHQSRLREPARLARLLLAVCLAYLWLMHVATYVVKRGLRALVDRRDRRDRSLPAIGRHWIRRQITNGKTVRTGLVPYF